MEEIPLSVKPIMRFAEYHYYLVDGLLFRIPVSDRGQPAEQYDKYRGFLPVERQMIFSHGLRITWEAFIRHKTDIDLSGSIPS